MKGTDVMNIVEDLQDVAATLKGLKGSVRFPKFKGEVTTEKLDLLGTLNTMMQGGRVQRKHLGDLLFDIADRLSLICSIGSGRT